MKLPLTNLCASGGHCGLCRERVKGHAWRKQLAAAYAVPGDVADFECPPPYSKPWMAGGVTIVPRITPWPDNAVAICRTCMDRSCGNVTCQTCAGGADVILQVPCKLGRW